MTLLHGLLTVQEVARQFEFNPLQQGVLDIRDSPGTCAKPAHLAGIFASRSPERCSPQGSDRIFADSSLLAEPTVDVDAFNEYGSEALIIGESGWAVEYAMQDEKETRTSAANLGLPSDVLRASERLLLRCPRERESDAAGQQ